MNKLVLSIPHPTPSLNELTNRRSRWAYTALRARWMKFVSDAWFEVKDAHGRGPALWCKPPRCRVRVTIERFGRSANALDPDNLRGGLKPVLDASRRLEFVDNDNVRAIDLVTEQPKNPYRTPALWTRITLERLS